VNLSEYKRQRKLGMISLEYWEVIRMTRCPEFMVKAHSTLLLQPQALMLWLKICLKHNIPTEKFVIRWTTKCRARGGRRYGCGYLKFNTTRLTVGQVLHEMAHVLQFMKPEFCQSKPHGREFVMLFDILLGEYYSNQLS
jgi:hypothetical protein